MKTLQETGTLEDAEMVVKEGAQLINVYRRELWDITSRTHLPNEIFFSMVRDFARLYWLKSIGLDELEFGEEDV